MQHQSFLLLNPYLLILEAISKACSDHPKGASPGDSFQCKQLSIYHKREINSNFLIFDFFAGNELVMYNPPEDLSHFLDLVPDAVGHEDLLECSSTVYPGTSDQDDLNTPPIFTMAHPLLSQASRLRSPPPPPSHTTSTEEVD